MSSNRKLIVKALEKKFSSEDAKNYEDLIYKMCLTLADDVFDESLEEIYQYYAYEKVGQLMEGDLQETLNDIKKCRLGKDAFYHRKFNENKEIPQNEPLIRSGVFPCRKRTCRAHQTKETIYITDQRRSGDEGMSVIIKCRVCGSEYTVG
mgnify:CR=1 FL=1